MPLRLERGFQLWSFHVSHSVLLLRSPIGPGTATRMDLMFRSVSAVQLRRRYDRLDVAVLPPSESLHPGLDWAGDLGGRVTFSVGSGSHDRGVVVAGVMFLSEDDLSDQEPSTVDHRELSHRVISSGFYRPT